MFKKLKLIIITLFIVFSTSTTILADDITNSNEEYLDLKNIINTASNDINYPEINSKSAVVIDRKTNTILYGKNENNIRKMASTTKIMTCLVVLENGNLDDIVEISRKAASTGGSRLGLKTNDKISVKDLLYGLMLCSGNDSAVALAEYISGSINDFSILMNTKAKTLNLEHTNFETPHGLDSNNHYTTAYELAILSNHALKNETFAKIVSTKNYTVTINGYPKNINNTNELLGYLEGIYGIKTGFTNGANRCLVTACRRNDLDIICVVLGADTKNFRTKDSIKLIEYSFKTFVSVNVQEILDEKFEEWKNNNLTKFKIVKSKNQEFNISILPLENPIIPVEKISINDINIYIDYKNDFYAPINKDSLLGTANIYVGNKLVSSTNITFSNNIEKMNFVDYLKKLLKCYNNIYL